jgi:site-specific recombinase XerD
LVTQTKTDVKTVQSMLRHADIGTTLDIYTRANSKDKLAAQNQVMEAMPKPRLVEKGVVSHNVSGELPS